MQIFATHGELGRANKNASQQPLPQVRGALRARLLRAPLTILSLLVCGLFFATALILIIGVATGNPAQVGLVVWALPRLGFLALVVLLFRFASATEPQPNESAGKTSND